MLGRITSLLTASLILSVSLMLSQIIKTARGFSSPCLSSLNVSAKAERPIVSVKQVFGSNEKYDQLLTAIQTLKQSQQDHQVNLLLSRIIIAS